ncbi:hypothetical protein Hte_003782 [Hypoxylon texense]
MPDVRNPTMESLPVEILIQIFSHFCFHCQHPGHFPNADTHEARNDKRFLARLCRTSKAICAVAQPILYHYYATGNSRLETKLYRGQDEVGKRRQEPDFLPQFVRSIAQRPDLAAEVTAMHIVQGDVLSGYDGQTQMIESLFELSVTRKLLPRYRICDGWLDGRFSEWRQDERKQLHMWLATLAMLLAPRLRSLLLAVDHNAAFWTLEDSPRLQLPSLHTLGLVGHGLDYHFNELEALYAASPNLRTIYACDAAGRSQNVAKAQYSGYDYKLVLPNVKKLAVSDLIPDHLGNLLPCVPKLEDLEYYWDGTEEFGVADFAELLEPVKTTLKRLCIEFLPRSSENILSDPFPTWIDPPRVNYAPVRTFRGFESLEDLTISCYLIHRERDRDEADRLTALLPKSIRKLRISYLYKGMEKSLRELAAVAPDEFPLLKAVVIGIAERTDPRYDYGIDRTRALGGLFGGVGIRVSFKKDFLGPDPRTIIPGAMADSRLIPVPRVMDGTTDFELEEE